MTRKCFLKTNKFIDMKFKIRKRFAIISIIILFLILVGGFSFKPILDYKYAIEYPCLYGDKDCTYSEKFMCPNDYATAEEYIRALVLWSKTQMAENPQITQEELFEIRREELMAHNCENSKWWPVGTAEQ